MSDPQRTIPRAPRTLLSSLAAAALLVIASGVFAAGAEGLSGGIAAALCGLAGLGVVTGASRREARRFERETRARTEAMAAELEHGRQAETRLRAELRAAQAAHEESEERRRHAESSDLAKTAFLSNLSSELRTPLNNVLGMAGILLDTHLSESQADYARTIYGGAEALLIVVDDLIDLSRLDDGDLALDEREFELSYCVEGAAETCASRTNERAISIDVGLDPSIPAWVTGDRRRVRQVLIALIDRAIEGALESTLQLSAHIEESTADCVTIRFEIKPPSAAEGDAPADLPGASSSVGMSLAFRLIQAMGGSVHLGADGVSSTFSIRLRTSPRALAPAREGSTVELAGMRMLLVSTSGDCEAVARVTARGIGMEIDVVATGTEALDLLKRLAPSGREHAVIAIDAELPDISGTELAGILRTSSELMGFGCILLQSPGHGARPEELSRQGFDAWLKKPLSEKRLRTALLHVTAEPRVPVHGRRDVSEPQEAESALPHVGAQVLLAEDNLVNQRVTTLILERLGCRVVIAGTGMQAIEQVMTHDFDVVLMDCLMPELSGFDATRAIRCLSDPIKSQIPIVALTAGAGEEHRRACLDSGMNAHLSKPVRTSLLASVLLHWTGSRVTSPKEPPMSEPSPIDAEVLASLKELGGDDPSIFVELVELFLSDTPQRMRTLESAQESGDVEAVAASAHALKSSCGNLGAMALYEMFRDIESFGRSGDVDRIASLIPKVRSEFTRVEDALRRESAGNS